MGVHVAGEGPDVACGAAGDPGVACGVGEAPDAEDLAGDHAFGGADRGPASSCVDRSGLDR